MYKYLLMAFFENCNVGVPESFKQRAIKNESYLCNKFHFN